MIPHRRNVHEFSSAQNQQYVAPVFGYTALGQFTTTAELALAIGTSYHGAVHNTIGGTMATFSSPLAPIFYPWHGYIDHIWALGAVLGRRLVELGSTPEPTSRSELLIR